MLYISSSDPQRACETFSQPSFFLCWGPFEGPASPFLARDNPGPCTKQIGFHSVSGVRLRGFFAGWLVFLFCSLNFVGWPLIWNRFSWSQCSPLAIAQDLVQMLPFFKRDKNFFNVPILYRKLLIVLPHELGKHLIRFFGCVDARKHNPTIQRSCSIWPNCIKGTGLPANSCSMVCFSLRERKIVWRSEYRLTGIRLV